MGRRGPIHAPNLALSGRVVNLFGNRRGSDAFGFLSGSAQKGPPIIKLKPAKTAMIQTSTENPLHQVQETVRHPVDLIPFPELGQTIGAAFRAPAFRAQVKLIPAGDFIPIPAFPALVNGHVAQALPEIPVNTLESGVTALATFGHCDIYTPDPLNSSRDEAYGIHRMSRWFL